MLRGTKILFQAADAVEGRTKKGEATEIHSNGVTKFVRAPVVVLGVNGNILADQQTGHGTRHHGSVKNSHTKTRRSRRTINARGGTAQQLADSVSGQDDQRKFEQTFPPGKSSFDL